MRLDVSRVTKPLLRQEKVRLGRYPCRAQKISTAHQQKSSARQEESSQPLDPCHFKKISTVRQEKVARTKRAIDTDLLRTKRSRDEPAAARVRRPPTSATGRRGLAGTGSRTMNRGLVTMRTRRRNPRPLTRERGRGGGGRSLAGEGESGRGVRSPARSNYSSPTSGLAHAS